MAQCVTQLGCLEGNNSAPTSETLTTTRPQGHERRACDKRADMVKATGCAALRMR